MNVALAFLALPTPVTAAATGKACCQTLEAAGLNNVYYPGSANYILRQHSYFSVSAELEPHCFIQPTTVQEISQAVKTLNHDTDCNWAIRSGGHATWAGANNIVDGVTIDLREFKGTTYIPSTQTAQINAGSLWGEVYADLEPHGVTVAGGRSSIIGVGGFLLGGGNTFYTAERGFGCDQVVNFEVVLASGETTSANETTNPDLYRALKGGSSNFALVTRFDLAAFSMPEGCLWGGMLVYDGEDSSATDKALLEAYQGWASDEGVANYRSGSAILAWVYLSDSGPADDKGGMFVALGLADTSGGPGEKRREEGEEAKVGKWDKGDARNVAPAAFDRFLDIPHIGSTIRKGSHLDLTKEIDMPDGYRNIWFTLTMRNHPSVYATSHSLYKSFISEWKGSHNSSLSQFMTYEVFQAAPTFFAENSAARGGGNVMGLLEESEEPENAVIYMVYLLIQGDEEEEELGKEVMTELREKLKEANKGCIVRWEYLNYADTTQDVLASYGERNVEFMRKVARKYDPEGAFQKRVPGGFKIPGIATERLREL